ncbi:hypothetical protein EBI_26671 [Enterocytozoon bieneusi H348]|nr:hypothetical protein EBI_26671 [Enterocytozoon bieneusi H348]|eukprot:XP_002650709.1 hypothetical protein EBI_26671 [Enterocytozoon bieneusi H348]
MQMCCDYNIYNTESYYAVIEDAAEKTCFDAPVLDSFNIRGIVDEIKGKATEPLILDFTQCAFVDVTGNIALRECIDALNIKYEKIGSPMNLYKI